MTAGGEPLYPKVGSLRVMVRGLRRRCPRCAERDIFTSWFHMRTECPRCRLRFEQEEGGYLGAMVLNYSAGIAAWIVVLIVGLVLTVPDIPVVPLTAISLAVLIVVPLWFYPRSKSMWAGVEYLVARNDPDYREPVKRDPRAKDLE